VWLAKEIPLKPKFKSSLRIKYPFQPGQLVGAIHFPDSSQPNDFRGQTLKPGTYTLRYGLQPDDGNHLGVAPSRDFLLLVPPSADPGPEVAPNFLDVVALSRKASGTKHPAPLSLVPAEGGTAPAITKDDEGHFIFTATVHLSSGEDLPIALVVKGTAPQ
jgi:hypothetical protein